MKTFINKVLAVAILTIASIFVARAQQQPYTAQLEEKVLPVSEFTSLSVSQNFEVTLVKGTYSARITVDKVLSPYVQVYVRSKTLYITYDEKAVPKDVRKLFKGRNAPKPIFRASVYMPQINTINLDDNATLSGSDEFVGNDFEANLTGNAQIKGLTLSVKSAKVSLKKNSQAALNIRADEKIEFTTEGNSNLQSTANTIGEFVCSASGNSNLTLSSDNKLSTITTAGNAELTITQKTDKLVLQTNGNSSLIINGEADALVIKGERNSKIDANAFEVNTAEASLSGNSRADINVKELLDATLVGGSALYYTGTPVFKIGKVIKSTLAPYGATAK